MKRSPRARHETVAALPARAERDPMPADTPWGARAAAEAAALDDLPCVGQGPHTKATVNALHEVRLCWADWARGYDLLSREEAVRWRA